MKSSTSAHLETRQRARVRAGEAVATGEIALAAGDFSVRGGKVAAQLSGERAVFFCLAGDAQVSDQTATVKLRANQRLAAKRGAKLSSLRPENGRPDVRWAEALAPREQVVYRASRRRRRRTPSTSRSGGPEPRRRSRST